jgi:radical SAM family protein/iron-sulfur cluster protein/4Fe-4S single cluster protein
MPFPAPSLPPLVRDGGRPVRRRTRTFRPNYLSFAGTYQCNLSCPHCCVPIEWSDRLNIATAIAFLEDARNYGIRILGLTGGEPFIYPEFVMAICRRASELGFAFDKIMTNGVWFRDHGHLQRTLQELADTGFSGKLGLSVDKFHGIATDQLAEFCLRARQIFGRDNIISVSYASRAPDLGLEPVYALAKKLDGFIEWSDLLRRYLLVTPELTITLNWNHLAPVERAERFTGGWKTGATEVTEGTEKTGSVSSVNSLATSWFKEDYCEGPGQALIVNPRGDVKPCCGFASDLDQLTIGNIYRHSVKQIVRMARKHPYVGKVFREGLTSIRDEILARDPDALPGTTTNHCFFCWYVLTRGLASGVDGGGGQIGSWTGARANFTGDLIQIGVPKKSR